MRKDCNLTRRIAALTTIGLVGLAGTALAGPRNARDLTVAADSLVNATLRLDQSALSAVLFDPTPGIAQQIDVDLDGDTYTLDLHPHSVRSDNYRLFVVGDDGVQREVPAGPVRTLRGTVLGHADSIVAAAIDDTGLRARVRFANGAEFWVEPVSDRFGGFQPEDHVVYRTEHAQSHGTCGTTDEHKTGYVADGGFTLRGGTNVCVTELACDADFEYFQDYGSASAVEDRINIVINAMNVQYESEVGISHAISTIIVRTSSSDPYTTSDPGGLLNQFRGHWEGSQGGIPRDVAQLFTGRNLDGSVIGIAWLNAICGSFGYGVVQSDFTGSFACVTDLSAHELGHNWGAGHCSCPSHTMNPGITCSNTFNPTDTRPDITSFRNSLSCLDCAIAGTPIPLIEYVIKKGVYVSGGLSDLQSSDNAYLRVQSTVLNNRKMRTFTIAVFEAPASSLSQINVKVEAGNDDTNVVGQIALRDFTTQSWVRFDQSPAPQADTERFVFNVPDPDRFINPDNNRIRVKVWQRRNGTSPSFESRIDHVEVTIQP